jgi:transcriptional accessory protein Tex/SPT6
VLEVDEQRRRVSLSMKTRDLEGNGAPGPDGPRGEEKNRGKNRSKNESRHENRNEEKIDLSLGSLFKQQLADAGLPKGRRER